MTVTMPLLLVEGLRLSELVQVLEKSSLSVPSWRADDVIAVSSGDCNKPLYLQFWNYYDNQILTVGILF